MIKRIKVDNLWGERSIDWTITRQVSVLSGTNGTGKSTVLRSVFELFSKGALSNDYFQVFDRLEVELDDGQIFTSDKIFNPDSITPNVLSNLCSLEYFDQAEVLSFTTDSLFCDTIDRYLSLTRKTIVRNRSEVFFNLPSGRVIGIDMLSSGEKELLKIFALASRATAADAIILDEPENSLHFDWQKTLLESIISIAPGVQIITATHSPAIIMDGWVANIDNIDKITTISR